MPPVPPAPDADSQNLMNTIERYLTDLSTVQIPRLRSCTGPLSTQQTWAAEIQEDLKNLAERIEDLDLRVEDQRTDRTRKELKSRVDAFRSSLKKLQADSRDAILTSKRAIDAQSRSRREELFRLPSTISKKTSSSSETGKSTEASIMTASNRVTEALQRTMGLMQNELERSVLSVQLLESSTSTLTIASEKHDNLSLILDTSRQLVTTLQNADLLDRLLLISALVFFFLVVAFVLKQRVIDRGIRLAFWWTRFIPAFGSRSEDVVGQVLDTAAATPSSVMTPAVMQGVAGSNVVLSTSAVVAASAASAVGVPASITAIPVVLEDGTTGPQASIADLTISPFPPLAPETSGVGSSSDSTHDEL